MADEDMQGIRVGVNDEGKRKAEKGVAGMKKVACPLFLPVLLRVTPGEPSFEKLRMLKGLKHRLSEPFLLILSYYKKVILSIACQRIIMDLMQVKYPKKLYPVCPCNLFQFLKD